MSNPLLDQETAIGEDVKMWLRVNQHPHNAPQQKKCYYVFENAEIYALYLCIIQMSKPATSKRSVFWSEFTVQENKSIK